MRATPTLVLKNNLDVSKTISLMNRVSSIQSFINQTTQYIFNMSCEGFTGTNRVRLRSRTTAQSVFSAFDAIIIGEPNVFTAAAALNTLNQGQFVASIEGGVPYIKVNDNTRVYQNIRLFNVNPALVSDVFWENFSVTNTQGGLQGFYNCVLSVNMPEGADDSQTDTLQYGTLIKVVVNAGNITDIFWNVNDNLGNSLAGGVLSPGQPPAVFSFVNNLPNNGFGGYGVTALDNL